MSLDLHPEVEKLVRERAAAEGVSVNDLLARTFAASEPDGALKRVRTLLTQWQAEDTCSPSPPERTSGTALFERWRELDARMTEEEREAEDRLWEDVVRGMDETRALLGMRPLSP